ncbi:MAG: ACT domain-containing protein [Clostridia bacterium]|nr:ACT domain-containing protein [Clostridia bacterium]
MFIKQLSVFIENKDGRLAEITGIIANAGIDIRAISISDTTDFGILRLIVDKPEFAEKALKEAGLTVSLSNVIAVGIPDKKGGIAETLAAIADKDVSVEYMYEYIVPNSDHAYFIIRVADNEKAVAALQSHGCELLTEVK